MLIHQSSILYSVKVEKQGKRATVARAIEIIATVMVEAAVLERQARLHLPFFNPIQLN